jgi:hypothetical protein
MQILPSLREEAEAIYKRLFVGVTVDETATLKRLLGTMSTNLEP